MWEAIGTDRAVTYHLHTNLHRHNDDVDTNADSKVSKIAKTSFQNK